MKTKILALFATTLLGACSAPKLELGEVEGEGGSKATGGAMATGGTPETGGTPGSGGTPETGGTPGSGGTPETGGTPGSGGTPGFVPANWTSLRLEDDTGGGFRPEPPVAQGTACERYEHPNVYEVDATQQTLKWDYCAWPSGASVERHGEMPLSSSQMLAVRHAVAGLGPGGTTCGADKGIVLLDVVSDDGTLALQDDFYACQPPLNGRTFVSNIDPLEAFLREWAWEASQPSLERLTLTASGGFTVMSDPDSECAYHEYPNTYSVTLATRELTWDLCRISTPATTMAELFQGSRTLSVSELTTLTSAYADVVVAVADCSVADMPLVTLDAETSEATLHYVERTNTCSPPPVSVHPAANVDGR